LTITPTTTTTYTLTVGNGISTCSESVTIVVDPLPQANLPDTLKVCGTQAQLNATAGFTSYLWNKSGTSNSITIDSSGKYIVKVTDANGCINYDTTLVSVLNAKIIAPITSTCYGSAMNLFADSAALKSIVYPRTYTWQPNTIKSSKLQLDGKTGGYYTLEVSNAIHTCKDSVQISINPLPIPALTKNIKYCGDSILVQPNQGFANYTWNTEATSPSIYADTSGWYKVRVQDNKGCTQTDSTLVSVIKAKIKADTIVLCMGNHVNLEALIKSNQSTLYPDQLLWSTNEQSKIIQVSPLVQTTYTLTVSNGIAVCTDQVQLNVNSVSTEFFGTDTLYACADSFVVKAVDGLHNFKWKDDASTAQQIVIKKDAWVVLTAQNANNCIATDSVFVHFTNTNFTLSDTVVCAGAGTIIATAIETGGVFSGPHVLNNQFNVPSTGGMYSISYTINNGTCSKTTTKWIRVIQRKDPSFLASAVKLCKNDGPVQFTFTDASGLFYKDNSLFNSSIFVANQVGKYVFKYVVKAEFCTDSSSQQIEVIERPNAKFNPAKLVACVGDPAIPLNPVVAGGIFSGEHIQQNSFIPTKAGKFKIVYTMSNDKCTDTSSVEIVVYNNPSGVIAYNPLAPLVNESIHFSYNGTAVNTYLWNFGSTANPTASTSASPSIKYENNGIVKVYLTVQNAEGCVSNLEATINIKDNSSLFVPNAFTPGVDGVNDMFYLVGEGISKLNFIIYNRWGEMIFESTDMNKAWDGKYGGQPCPAGVYYYILDATGTDKKIYQMNGTITLIR
jgi:gliding motility-associated-like protein